ncbi:MAG: 2-oxoglutarate oxidoreductase [Chloroflexi bacterium]|nr:2-oxoglutarate oxidoreductase [Chloroflexota bacterium]
MEYCPGCTYGVFENILTETIQEMGLKEETIGVTGIGCSQTMLRGSGMGGGAGGMDFDNIGGLHGRALMGAVAAKRCNPKCLVFSIQGDGALAGIGSQHWLGAMIRGEKITAILLNNAVYGMTGGQVAPTTLLGLRTVSTPWGRDPEKWGFPIHAAETAATFRGVAYSARVALNSPQNFTRAKKALRTAFEKQRAGVGMSFVEFLSACPTDWQKEPVAALKFLGDKMIKEFPLGEFKNVDKIEYEIDPEVAASGRTGGLRVESARESEKSSTDTTPSSSKR